MRELAMPSLFDSPPAVPPLPVAEEVPREENRGEKLARDFVKWCFSFGSAFRNSPDVINLRTWAHKTHLKLNQSDESAALAEARRLYLKRIEQMMKKSDAPILKPEIVVDAPALS
jgi:hypothetical protein